MSDALKEMAAALEELQRRQTENRLANYQPYPKQAEFHALGATHRERALIAGNQCGKTLSASMETAMHLTGQYPEWWQGRRFNKPTRGWALGVTTEGARDTCQRLLLGPLRDGTGSIPKASIIDIRMGRGIPDAVDTVLVKHVSGGTSQLGMKSYERGREKLQGETIDFAWPDEEPPADIYSEILARITATRGMVYSTFTPLLGMSSVCERFLSDSSEDRAVVQMALEDAGHVSDEERARIIAGYPAHEREARVKGVPMLGSGRIFQISEEVIGWDALAEQSMPAYWARICGVDFGIDHPFAAVWMAWDRDADCIYLYDAYKISGASALQHADAMKSRGFIPTAWPHDGHVRDKGSGEPLSALYKRYGVNMLSTHATFPDGSTSVEAGILEMQERMQTGRFKVARHLSEWFEEFRMYHRKDGRIVKERDDLLSATRYALMMRRFAKAGGGSGYGQRRKTVVATGVDYDVWGYESGRG